MTSVPIDFAAPASVFDHLSGYARDRLARISRTEAFDAGATILAEGGATPFLGVVESGRIALRLRVPEQGDRLTILTIEPGELFGWSAVVPPYRATIDAIATEPATIHAIDAPELRTMLARDADLAAEVLPLVIESLAARLAGSWHQLLDLFATRTAQPW